MMRGLSVASVLGLAMACAAQARPVVVVHSMPTLLHISSHLPKAARVTLDGKPAIAAPGYGSTDAAAIAGHHLLKVVTAAGVSYQLGLDLAPTQIMAWKGKGYWCVNLLERSFEVYSAGDCREEVTDAG